MITYTTELLYHFKCGECLRWWSIGDHQFNGIDEMTCPHCGKIQDVQPNLDCESTEIGDL